MASLISVPPKTVENISALELLSDYSKRYSNHYIVAVLDVKYHTDEILQSKLVVDPKILNRNYILMHFENQGNVINEVAILADHLSEYYVPIAIIHNGTIIFTNYDEIYEAIDETNDDIYVLMQEYAKQLFYKQNELPL